MHSEEKNQKKQLSFSDFFIRFLIIVIILLVIFLGVMICITMFSKTDKTVDPAVPIVRKNVVVYDSTVSQTYDPEKLNNVSNHDVKMNSEWTFSDGAGVSKDAYVENPSSNINTVYFDIINSVTGDLIFTSPLLPPGSHIEYISLDKELPAGNYNCILTYHLIGSDEEQSVGELQMALKITVKS